MNRPEAAILLGVAAAFDQRTIGETDVTAWAEALARYDLEPCRRAVIGHYTETTDRIMPAHITRRIRAVRPEDRTVAEVLAEQAGY